MGNVAHSLYHSRNLHNEKSGKGKYRRQKDLISGKDAKVKTDGKQKIR
jgi:hypothetical protein